MAGVPVALDAGPVVAFDTSSQGSVLGNTSFVPKGQLAPSVMRLLLVLYIVSLLFALSYRLKFPVAASGVAKSSTGAVAGGTMVSLVYTDSSCEADSLASVNVTGTYGASAVSVYLKVMVVVITPSTTSDW